MTGGTFFERIAELRDQVGEGDLTMRVEMNQVYAKYQELREDLNHPRGGGPHYTRDGLLTHTDEYLETLAAGALHDLRGAAKDVVGRFGRNVEAGAPVEFVNLRRSAHEQVLDRGSVVHDREPDVHRLSEQELRHQREYRYDYDAGGESDRPRDYRRTRFSRRRPVGRPTGRAS